MFAATAAALVGVALFAAPASAEQDVPPGTSFTAAGKLKTGDEARWSASAGEYLYWQFPATAGKDIKAKVDLELAPGAARSGPVTYRIEIYDGLRRRQPCVEGNQVAAAQKTDAKVSLTCTPRTVRDWSEPWSTDPLPGTYFVRVAAMEVPELDAGLPIKVTVRVDTKDGDDQVPTSDRQLSDPLVPITKAGAVLQKGQSSDTRSIAWDEEEDHWYTWDWMSGPNARWFWTALATFVAALMGILGFQLTRKKRSWFS
ncbi:peptidase [Streptomyces sp. SID3343]|uniref:peptidase n=1 Tax=Streptomyces sp. SID3343 TaxID=2690260 RepID=UPI001368A90B|nr:peptidase [Streptomyces sp. SID3343]MYW01269.1 peptidase [Streptomyces sp. SID3343]